MIKQSAYVIALLLGNVSAIKSAPESVNLFATGMNGDEDLGQDIIMKGEKFHYVGKDAANVQLQGDDPAPEKVVVMEPIPNQALSNGANGEGIEAFPNAPRTAFYMQYDPANQLWRNQLAQDPLPYTQQVAGPDVEAPIGKTVHDAAVDGCDAQPLERHENGKYAQMSEPGDGYGEYGTEGAKHHNANLGEPRRDKWVYEFSRENVPPFATHAQSEAQQERTNRDIGEGNMDESVHTFASEDTNVLPLPRRRRQTPYDNNGSHEKAHSLSEKVHHHHHHHHAKDIGEGNIDEEVHGVASIDTNVLPVQKRRSETAYDNNGSHEKAHSLSQHHHHHHHDRKTKDIGEGNIDEEVHGVASADTHVLPIPRRRRQTPYDNNGSHEKAHSLYERAHHHHHNKKDIGEGNIDEEVHGVASADTHVLPQPARRAGLAYAGNGSGEKAHALYERTKKDIGEGNIDEEVHGVASADTHVLPIPRRRRQTPYDNNGSHEKAHSLVERSKKDIGEGNIDEEVHGVASADTHVLPIPRRRRQTPYDNNGSHEKAHSLVELERNKKDIGEGNIDEEVHGVASADTHVLPIPRRRRQTPYANNGSGEKSHSLAELEKGDIANKQVRSDVYTTVDNMIGQVPAYRRKTQPKHKFVPFKSGQGIEGDNNGPSGVVTATKGGAAAQKAAPTAAAELQLAGDDDKKAAANSGAEKVSEILPLEYQHRANTNKPNLRTTFYAEQQ